MTNKAFNDLRLGFDTTYTYNEYFKKYVDANFQGHKNMYGSIDFSTEDMKTARKFWKQNAKNHSNYPWLMPEEVEDWIDKMPFGGYEY